MTLFKEYLVEHGRPVNLESLAADELSLREYATAHQHLSLICHDILLAYNDGILLVKRKVNPAADDSYWCFGGRVLRGKPAEESLCWRVKRESNLDVDGIAYLGCARTFFRTDPFDHGKGTDTINLMYFGKGKGELRLDDFHTAPLIVRPPLASDLQEQLHPYMRDMIDLCLPLLKK